MGTPRGSAVHLTARAERVSDVDWELVPRTPPGRRARPDTTALYEKLVPAPHAMSGEQVAAIQRKRLCGAMVHAVAEHGYGKVTVARLHGLAGVSRRTLYDRFGRSDAKQQCLLATVETVLALSLERARALQRRGGDWRARLALTLGALAQDIARHPGAASVVLIEAYDPQARAHESLAREWERYEELLADCFCDEDDEEPPSLVVKGVLAGAAHLARVHLLAGSERQLPRRAVDELTAWACACCSDAALSSVSGASSFVIDAPLLVHERSPQREEDICEERRWMLEACVRLAARDGYDSLTVSRIERDARVARGTLRRHFTNVRECFIDAYELVCKELLRDVLAHTPAAFSPVGRRPALERLADRIAERPDVVRIAFCEVLAAGPAGVRAQTRLLESFARTLADRLSPDRRPPPVTLSAGVAAVWSLAGHLAARGYAERLPSNCKVLSRLMPPVLAACHSHTDRLTPTVTPAPAAGVPRNQKQNRA